MNIELNHISDYYSDVNKKTSFHVLDINYTMFYFSYSTIVGYRKKGQLFITDKTYSNTTARHLTIIDPGKENRIPHDQFIQGLEKALNELNQ